MDARGLAVIVAAAERARATGGNFRIVRGLGQSQLDERASNALPQWVSRRGEVAYAHQFKGAPNRGRNPRDL